MRKLYGDQEMNISRAQICIDGHNVDCWIASSSVRADIARLKKMGWELVNENPDGSCVLARLWNPPFGFRKMKSRKSY